MGSTLGRIWGVYMGSRYWKVSRQGRCAVPNVASCTFGGIGDSRLFITTALDGLSDMERREYPLSGSVFVVDVPKVVPGENHYPFITD